MIPVLTGAEMRGADHRTIRELGLPGAVLMENAGAAAAAALRERFGLPGRVAVLCGKGNNGGDGFVLARRLLPRSSPVLLVGRRAELAGDAALHAGAYERSGGETLELADEGGFSRLDAALAGADVIVDALLGTGLREAPSGPVAAAIERVRKARAERGTPVLALDLPSGVSSDSGRLDWPAVAADLTVAFAAPKWGHVLPPACDSSGELRVAEIGIAGFLLAQAGGALGLLEPGDVAAAFRRWPAGAHKGDRGHVLVVAGSLGKVGAAALAGFAALRAGAGLVTIATPAAALPALAGGRPELMVEPLPGRGERAGEESLARALELAQGKDAVVVGPGLGQGPEVGAFVRALVARCSRPLVLDADGLNAVAAEAGGAGLPGFPRLGPTLLTPHPGEMARLLGTTSAEVQGLRVESARRLAALSGAVAVLKGQRSVVADAGGRAAVNPTGNPGLATAGSGDVLSGVCGALLARHPEDPWLAATAAVFVHGLAGDEAARREDGAAMVAGDVTEHLGAAIGSLRRHAGTASA